MTLQRVTVAPKGMGLNDFVAQQEGFFAAEGLEVELDWKTFRGTQSSWLRARMDARGQELLHRFRHVEFWARMLRDAAHVELRRRIRHERVHQRVGAGMAVRDVVSGITEAREV